MWHQKIVQYDELAEFLNSTTFSKFEIINIPGQLIVLYFAKG